MNTTVQRSTRSFRASVLRGLLSLAAVLALGATLSACSSSEDPVESVRPVIVVQAGAGAVNFTAYPGEVHARREPVLAFRIPGKLSRRLVDAGDAVTSGQPLAELDAEDVRLQLSAARSALSAAKSDLDLASQERDRYRSLLDRGLVGQSQFDASDNAWRLATARMQQAQSQMEVARNQSGYAVLRAPADGVITQRMAEAGQVVAAGQPVFVLAENGEREVVISLPEHDIQQFKVGQPMLVELWSKPGQRFPATLRELSPAADALTRTYAARVGLGADVEGFDLGQSARVYAADPGATVDLNLPLAAVSADADQAYVWVVDPATSRLQRRSIETGAYTETSVPVITGLQAGDWVVAAGVHLLREGQAVRAVDSENRAVSLTSGS